MFLRGTYFAIVSSCPRPFKRQSTFVSSWIIALIFSSISPSFIDFVNAMTTSTSSVASSGRIILISIVSVLSPSTTFNPFFWIASICAGHSSIRVTSCPVFVNMYPKRHPIAPAPAIAIFILTPLFY